MEEYVPIMILGPLILILVVCTIADSCVIVLDIRRRGLGWIKNPFLAVMVSLVIAVSLTYCMISVVTALLNTIGLDGLK